MVYKRSNLNIIILLLYYYYTIIILLLYYYYIFIKVFKMYKCILNKYLLILKDE